jgi:hypothetical protein
LLSDERSVLDRDGHDPWRSGYVRVPAEKWVPFHWVDLERDPLVRLLLRDRDLDDLRRPCVLFENGSMLEPPARYVLVRFFQRFHSGGEPTSPEEQQVYVETSRWRSELSERAGLPTRPRHEEYDDLDLVGAELRRAAYRNRVLSRR